VEALTRCELTLLTERRESGPPGLAGGQPGRRGRNSWVHGGRRRRLDAKVSLQLEAGDRIRIETPGGGGFGRRRGS
jgi:N-methylhydantoinase B